MSTELIGIIAATVTLGTAMLASVRSIRHELRQEVRATRGELREARDELRGELREARAESRGELREARDELREEMQTGFKEINSRLINVGDRLSKVEGVIEGVFWGARSQPPDKPREGAA